MKGEYYTWDEQGLMSSVKAMNYTYDQGETDPEKGEADPVFELRYQYDDKAKTKVFWPMLPITEENGGFGEFSYDLKGYCKKAEHWKYGYGDPRKTFDFIYVFEASPRHLQELVDNGSTTVQYAYGTITAEGASLEGLQVYDSVTTIQHHASALTWASASYLTDYISSARSLLTAHRLIRWS